MPAPEPIGHPITGWHDSLGPGEQLQRIAGAGAPAVVETHPGSPDGLEYRLARPTDALGACLHSYS